jgi:2-keto-4-pentenoate hydratase/2-oxohepta-3-ene-1,7-dioic acid hydratase in catechol pathway
MIWSFGEVLEFLSQDFTFVLGDVIAGGTSAAPLPINRGDPKAKDRSISF